MQLENLKGREEESQRIARELHDGLGSLLTAVKLHFASIEKRLDTIEAENRKQYDNASKLLDDACEELRKMSHKLANTTAQKFSLLNQLQELTEALRQQVGLEVELSTHGLDVPMDVHLEINIFRIVQELTTNVIRHARASQLTIEVNQFNNIVNIIVADNGKGFRVEEVQLKAGIGMRNLAARVNSLDGKIHVDSMPGRGTTIIIDLPLEKTSRFAYLQEKDN